MSGHVSLVQRMLPAYREPLFQAFAQFLEPVPLKVLTSTTLVAGPDAYWRFTAPCVPDVESAVVWQRDLVGVAFTAQALVIRQLLTSPEIAAESQGGAIPCGRGSSTFASTTSQACYPCSRWGSERTAIAERYRREHELEGLVDGLGACIADTLAAEGI